MPLHPDPNVSEKQFEVVQIIIEHVEKHGFQPTHGEIGDVLGITKTAVRQRLLEAAARGFIEVPVRGRERAVIIKGLRFKAYFEDSGQLPNP
jgi:predicted transcriptional regulator